ncbi:hypothetical protein ACHQM5_010333 [Ranunculus cassubicifolius]
MAVAQNPVQSPPYMDEKWKLSKKEGSRRSSSTKSPANLVRNPSTKSAPSLMRNSSTKATPSLMRDSSKRRCAFTRKCATLVKEQRARFYIMRRCVTMLICWRDLGDS